MALSDIKSLVLIGAGKMGGAMLHGWLAKGLSSKAVTVVDPHVGSEAFSMMIEYSLTHVKDISELAVAPEIVVIAIKPQQMFEALPVLASKIGPETIIVSIAAGTTLATLESALGTGPIIRVMPNTPAQVGQGMSVGVGNGAVTEVHRRKIAALLNAVGKSAWVSEEAMIDAVTAVSGSGPAYVFYLVEALTEAAQKAGLPHDLALLLARQTVVGAGALLGASGHDPSTLRKNVTSPGGTTAAALQVLMAEDGLQPVLTAAVAAAAHRSRELAG
ncbi:pyrroline-5-carboxylate reductase [Oryzibacter oryziterrae]|uniref:pyrroline-5-carboxylate reductase n=1 Tax=Oryzibacter oryziterrae TaxID=2766474 RepID=UPI001F021431|nr:pyrroline-5-carboxylate reductase [Oryzibacter oryziterrae]